jgi:hypothetical protein
MYFSSGLEDGVVVKRQKLGVIEHVGIIVHDYGLPTVIHSTPDRGVIQESLTSFANGEPVDIVTSYYSPLPKWQIVNRARSSIGKKWTLFDNCQHFVTETLGLNKESRQLQIGLGVLAILFLCTR